MEGVCHHPVAVALCEVCVYVRCRGLCLLHFLRVTGYILNVFVVRQKHPQQTWL